MLWSIKKLSGYHIHATDGEIGKIEQMFFDDHNWALRYLVVDLGFFLTGKSVLLSPAGINKIENKSVLVNYTREQIRNSPGIDSAQTISRLKEIELHDYYAWPYYWTYPPYYNSLGGAIYPGLAQTPAIGAFPEDKTESEVLEREQNIESASRQSSLRGTREVTGYHIQATDEEIGHIDDFIIGDTDWVIRYLSIDTKNFLPGKKVLLSPQWVKGIDWEEAMVYVKLSHDKIKEAPAYDGKEHITRDYELKLYMYYDQKPYWKES